MRSAALTADIRITRELRSQYRGVVRGADGWYARLRQGWTCRDDGPYPDDADAARTYDAFWRANGHGKHRASAATLNFPTEAELERSRRVGATGVNRKVRDQAKRAEARAASPPAPSVRSLVHAYCRAAKAEGRWVATDELIAKFPGFSPVTLKNYRGEACASVTPAKEPPLPCTNEAEAKVVWQRAAELRRAIAATAGCLVEQRGEDGRLRLVKMEVRP